MSPLSRFELVRCTGCGHESVRAPALVVMACVRCNSPRTVYELHEGPEKTVTRPAGREAVGFVERRAEDRGARDELLRVREGMAARHGGDTSPQSDTEATG